MYRLGLLYLCTLCLSSYTQAQRTFSQLWMDDSMYIDRHTSITQQSDSTFFISSYAFTVVRPYYSIVLSEYDTSGKQLQYKEYLNINSTRSIYQFNTGNYFLHNKLYTIGGTLNAFPPNTGSNGRSYASFRVFTADFDSVLFREIGDTFGVFYSSVLLSNHTFCAAGATSYQSKGETDGWVVGLDTLGNTLWEWKDGGVGLDLCSTPLEIDGHIYFSWFPRQYYNSNDYSPWIVKLDLQGHEIWRKRYNKSTLSYGFFLRKTGSSIYALGGVNDSVVNGVAANYITISKIDTTGKVEVEYSYLRKGLADITGFFETKSKQLVMYGARYSDSTADYMGYVWKIAPDGVLQWDLTFREGNAGGRGYNTLSDGLEAVDGFYYFCGAGWNGPPITRGWLLKIDSNGCLYDVCGMYIDTTRPPDTPTIGVFGVYPNPASGSFRIELGDTSLGAYAGAYFSLYDVRGVLVRRIELNQLSTILSTDGIASGVYPWAITQGRQCLQRGKEVIMND